MDLDACKIVKESIINRCNYTFLINENIFCNIYRVHICNWQRECIFYQKIIVRHSQYTRTTAKKLNHLPRGTSMWNFRWEKSEQSILTRNYTYHIVMNAWCNFPTYIHELAVFCIVLLRPPRVHLSNNEISGI